MKHIIKFSGGKDSEAAALTVLNTVPREDIRLVFCDTGWEHPDTYQFIQEFGEAVGLPITMVRNPKYSAGMPDLVRARKRFPALRARFCTEALKVQPGIDYVLAQTDDVTVYQGVRADESLARRLLKRKDEYFRYYFEPVKFRGKYDKKINRLKKKLAKSHAGEGQQALFGNSIAQELAEWEQKNLRTLTPVFHTYRRKDVVAWCDKYSADVERPVITWTAGEVISYILGQGFKLNPLYYRGAKRVGCYPCINSSLSEVASIAENDPWRIDEIDDLEKEIGSGSAFFSNDKIPKAFHTGVWAPKKGDGPANTVNYIHDVVGYVQRHKDQAELLDKACSTTGCISHYNICENR